MPTEQQPAGTNPALSTQCETMRTTNDATKPTRSDDHVSTVAQAGVIATNPVGSAVCEAIATRVHPQPTNAPARSPFMHCHKSWTPSYNVDKAKDLSHSIAPTRQQQRPNRSWHTVCEART